MSEIVRDRSIDEAAYLGGLVVAGRVPSHGTRTDLCQRPGHGGLLVGRGVGCRLADTQRLDLAHHLVSMAVEATVLVETEDVS